MGCPTYLSHLPSHRLNQLSTDQSEGDGEECLQALRQVLVPKHNNTKVLPLLTSLLT